MRSCEKICLAYFSSTFMKNFKKIDVYGNFKINKKDIEGLKLIKLLMEKKRLKLI